MRKRIVRVSPIQAGKVLAVLYGILSLPIALAMAIAGALGKGKGGMPILLAFIFPVIYVVLGFIFTALAAWLYNHVAKWTGGIEFESEEQPEA